MDKIPSGSPLSGPPPALSAKEIMAEAFKALNDVLKQKPPNMEQLREAVKNLEPVMEKNKGILVLKGEQQKDYETAKSMLKVHDMFAKSKDPASQSREVQSPPRRRSYEYKGERSKEAAEVSGEKPIEDTAKISREEGHIHLQKSGQSSALQEYQVGDKTFFAIKTDTSVEGLPKIKDFEVIKTDAGIILKDTEKKPEGKRAYELFIPSKNDLEASLKEMGRIDLMGKMNEIIEIATKPPIDSQGRQEIDSQGKQTINRDMQEIFHFLLGNSRLVPLLWSNSEERNLLNTFLNTLMRIKFEEGTPQEKEQFKNVSTYIQTLLPSKHTLNRIESADPKTNIPYSHDKEAVDKASENHNIFTFLHMDAVAIGAKEFLKKTNLKTLKGDEVSKALTDKYILPIYSAFALGPGYEFWNQSGKLFILRKPSSVPDTADEEFFVLSLFGKVEGKKDLLITHEGIKGGKEVWKYTAMRDSKPVVLTFKSFQEAQTDIFKSRGIPMGIPQLPPDQIKGFIEGDKTVIQKGYEGFAARKYIPQAKFAKEL